jgi:hypothetical protein
MAWKISNQYATVWAIDKVEEKYAKVRLGTGDKKQDETYENSNWFSTFVGKARNRIEDLKPKDQITVVFGKVSNVGKKQDDGSYKNFLNVVIFDFIKKGESLPDEDAGLDKAPVVEDEKENELPF